jgi:hypothetical protein
MLKAVESADLFASAGALRRHTLLRRTVFGALALLLVLLLAFLLLAWQATRGSVSLNFFRGSIESAVREGLPDDARVAIGSTAFSYRRGEGIILRVRDLELVLPGAGTVHAGELSTVTTPGAMMSGTIALSSVTVSDVAISVSDLPQMTPAGTPAELLRGAVMSFVNRISEADAIIRGAGLREVTVSDAALSLEYPVGGLRAPLRIADANWMPLGSNRSKVWMQVVEDDGEDWDLTLEHRLGRTGNTNVALEIEGIPASTLLPDLSAEDDGPYLRSEVTLQARMTRTPEGTFGGMRGVISSGAGALSFTGQDEINLVKTDLGISVGANDDRLTIPGGEIRTQFGRIVFEGVVDLAEESFITLLTRVRGGFLPTTIGEERSIRLVGGGGLARLNLADLTLEVERLHLVTPEGTASAIGQASTGGATPGLSFALSFDEMSAAAIRALWPPFVAAKTRGWFDANVRAGVLGPATLQVALPPEFIGPRGRGKILPSYALIGSLPFRDAEFSPIKSFPPIGSAQGEIIFADATANVQAWSGVIAIPGRGDLNAAGTALSIPELGRLQARGDLHLTLTGPAAALAELSNTPPLAIAAKRGIVPDNLTGEAALSFDGNIPLYPSDFSDVLPTFHLTLTNFSSTTPIEERMIEDANLVLEGSPKSYTVKGAGTLDGFEAGVDMIMGPGAPGHTAVTAALDDEARERLGLKLGTLLTGPVQASLNQLDETHQHVALDLKEARISLPFLGWEKGPGVPATASFIMERTGTETTITDFLLAGKGFEARGTLTLGADGRLREMALDRLALRAGDQLALNAVANGGGYDVTVRGSAFDARGMVSGVRGGLGGGTADIYPIRVNLSVDAVMGQNDVVLSGVAGTLTVTRNGLDVVSLKGSVNESQPFEWTLGREGNTRVLRLFADAGGALIRFAGIYSRIAGGNLILDYSGPVGESGTGVLVLRDFRLLNETALKPALEGSSPRSAMTQANAQATNDLHFTQLRVPFRQEDWVVTIDDAALRGAIMGATASGTVNIAGGKMAISGTLIPAFGINNIAGAIPLLGAILGGGRDEGLVGITYKLFGPLDNPELVMNPISAIAPGIFRKIFEYR